MLCLKASLSFVNFELFKLNVAHIYLLNSYQWEDKTFVFLYSTQIYFKMQLLLIYQQSDEIDSNTQIFVITLFLQR